MTSEPARVASSPSRVDGIAVDRTMGAIPVLEPERSAEVPRIYLQVVDVEVGQEAVSNVVGLRPILDIRGSRQPVRKFVFPASGGAEVDVAARQPGKVVEQVFELPRDEMDDVSFPLNLAVDRHHRGPEDDAAPLLEQTWPDDSSGAGQRLAANCDDLEAVKGKRGKERIFAPQLGWVYRQIVQARPIAIAALLLFKGAFS